MSYKTILCYLPDEAHAERLLKVALPIARQHDAHLIGLHVIPRVPVMYAVAGAEIPVSIIQQQEEMLEREADQLKAFFEKKCAGMDARCEWRCNKIQHADMISEVVSQTLCADLVVMAQKDDDAFGMASDMPSRIVVDTGRPVLVVPRVGTFETVGKHVVVAWNGARESARAAFDAVPLLQQAESVRVLAIDPKCREGYDSIALGDEMALCLARHGVKAEATVTTSGSISVSAELLNRLAEEGCDLLVMGCYGHSRLRETLFGGVTADLLDQMTAPVLMSH